ncbi:LSU ribosomal protein L3P [Thermomonospora echinospora]|uniref:Large ribosomal subunit protein uL3 n=1 Tax=Thermomonospora echinospora TaxID=1992 RepID=A0A1H5Z7P9_9ACTN|nr:50S ribosomal protein L3 [Thermomonospora echinospora]SEG32361.1 LSU ribosomal protein L3P [Thermomonospora echinospora]
MSKQSKGVLGEKLGMTQVFDDEGRIVPVTVVQAGPCVVTQIRTPDNDGYSAVQIGYGQVDPRRVNKPRTGHFEKAGVTPRRFLIELRTDDASEYTLGQEITVEVFEAGQKIDVTGTSKGKGTAGVMKRHGFRGLGASHGTQRKHRSPGSIGGCATPGRVFKGLRMAGRMGNVRKTVQNLTIHAIDADKGLLLIKGAVPGPNGGLVLVRDAVKGTGK